MIYILRKSAQHRVEFSHPGDPDYNDKDLPECPYGTTCYRKNKQHRLDFKHTVRLRRTRRPQNSKPYIRPSNPHLRFLLGEIDLNTKLRKIVNAGLLTLRLMIWDHQN